MNQASRPTFYPLHPDFVKPPSPTPVLQCTSELSSSVQQSSIVQLNLLSSSAQQDLLSSSVPHSAQSFKLRHTKRKALIKMESLPLPTIYQETSAYTRTMLFSQPYAPFQGNFSEYSCPKLIFPRKNIKSVVPIRHVQCETCTQRHEASNFLISIFKDNSKRRVTSFPQCPSSTMFSTSTSLVQSSKSCPPSTTTTAYISTTSIPNSLIFTFND